MYQSDKWMLQLPNKETGFRGFSPRDVMILSGSNASLHQNEIDLRWNEKEIIANEEGWTLKNNYYARFSKLEMDDSIVKLRLGDTSVKEFMTTNVHYEKHNKEKLNNIKQNQLSNPIAVLSTVRTRDNYLPIPQRSSNVATYRNFYSLFGSAIGKDLRENSGSSENLFNYTKQSVATELAIDSSLLYDVTLTGITQTKFGHGDFGDFMILFKTELDMTREKLEKQKEKIGRRGDFKKYDDVFFISLDDRIELQGFLNQEHYYIVGTGEPGLVLQGRHSFDESFIDGLYHVDRISA